MIYCCQCVCGPTSMVLCSIIAEKKAKNANGTIMGIQQMLMNSGQGIGPVFGAWLFSINLWAPWIYVFIFEVLILCLNYYVLLQVRLSKIDFRLIFGGFRLILIHFHAQKRKLGEVTRGVFDFSPFDTSTLFGPRPGDMPLRNDDVLLENDDFPLKNGDFDNRRGHRRSRAVII